MDCSPERVALKILPLFVIKQVNCWELLGGGVGQKHDVRVRVAGVNWPSGLAAGPQDRRSNKAAGLATKLTVLWQWTGRYFEHWLAGN